jgi:YbbR domain-containing protein
VTLWFYVTSKGKSEMSITVPLEFRNIPAGMTVVGDVPGTLDVRVQGQERALRDIGAGKKVAGAVDLSAAKEGENVIRISPDDIRRPLGVFVTHLAPYEITVSMERLVRKDIKLKPVILGRPAAGLRLDGVSVNPPKITLEGPASVVNELTFLATMPIDIRGSRESFTVEPKIDYQGKPVKILEKDITVRIFIRKEKA